MLSHGHFRAANHTKGHIRTVEWNTSHFWLQPRPQRRVKIGDHCMWMQNELKKGNILEAVLLSTGLGVEFQWFRHWGWWLPSLFFSHLPSLFYLVLVLRISETCNVIKLIREKCQELRMSLSPNLSSEQTARVSQECVRCVYILRRAQRWLSLIGIT